MERFTSEVYSLLSYLDVFCHPNSIIPTLSSQL